jgi:class 3 adenylate cyclase/tetratricopeptide (TPR) repeat protein
VHCINCGTSNPPGAKFCNECAAALTVGSKSSLSKTNEQTHSVIQIKPEQIDLSSAPDGERKTVTALFADIKGSMELMEDLDPEEARAIIDPALRLMIEAARHYGGYVVQSTGDGIFALFGAPVAHEDHPQRALHAALRMQDEMRRLAERLRAEKGVNLQVRVGANVGDVVVRSIQTGASQVEYTPIGHSISLASRLQTLANPGSIAISDGLRKLVEDYFMLKALGPARIKGSSEPVNVYEVLGLGPLRTRLQRATGRGLTKFVGREHEMEALRHAAELAREGRGQLVAVMAEPGVGKSRLFYEFTLRSQSGWMVLEAFSISHGKASAYLPVVDLLRNYFEIAPADDECKRREKIAGKITVLDRSLEDTLPYLFSLLGIVEGDDPLADTDGQLKKRRTLEAIKRILLRESLKQPLMVIFEDLHWMDGESEALLNLLAGSIGTSRVLLLVNYRPEYSHKWGSKTYYTQLHLDPLGKESADEMLDTLLSMPLARSETLPIARSFAGEGKGEGAVSGEGADLVALKRLIVERTDGTPFFMEEMVQSLFEEGVLQRNGIVTLAKPLSAIKVPATVQAVLAWRIDRLAPAEKELLQTLAVVGPQFMLTLVQQVMLKSSDELEQMLSQLQLGEFINEQPAVGEVEYTFKHALTQEVAYSSVLIERRKALHERTGEAIETLFADRLDDYVTDLAHHYERSGNLRKAIEYLEQSARRAAEQAAHSEVAGYVTRALELIKRLPDGTNRARHELELEMTLNASMFAEESPEREKTLVRALELCEQLGDSRIMEVMLSLGSLRTARSEPLPALQLFEKALALAEQAKDADMLAAAHAVIGMQLYFLGQFKEARKHSESTIELSGGRPPRKFDPVLFRIHMAHIILAHILLALGYPITALKRSKDALDSAHQHTWPYINALVLYTHVMIYFALRDIRAVAEQVEELAAIAAEHEMPVFRTFATFYRAWLTANAGQVNEGLGEMRRIITQLGVYPMANDFAVALAEICGRNGLPDEGLVAIKGALTRSEKTPYLQAELYRLMGELTMLKDPGSEAEAEYCLRQAVGVARR